MFKSLVTSLVLVVAGANGALASGKVHHTYPMPRKPQKVDPLSVSLGIQIPDNQDFYSFVTAPSKYMGTDEIFVYYIDPQEPIRKRSKIGSMPAGTEVKLNGFTSVGKILYYQVPYEGRTAWISGHNIKASSYNPPVQ